jgi:hypothetical protein
MMRAFVVVFLLSACAPTVIGAPCSSDQFCPTGQVCIAQRCALANAPPPGPGPKELKCANGQDDDGDGLIDCADSDCLGTVCRESAGPCDQAEVCDGTTCPSDAFKSAQTTCRAAVSNCDVEERCSAASSECPADTQRCAANETCESNGKCIAKLSEGRGCKDNAECLSGFCTDGFCCESACMGVCQQCNQTMARGKCLPVAKGEDPRQQCGPNGQCSGQGACLPSDCTKSGCGAELYCETNGTPRCVPVLENGAICATDEQCKSTQCLTIYRDGDGDGFGGAPVPSQERRCGPYAMQGVATKGGDCCDDDLRAFPGQLAYFGESNSCDSFDYNCSGKEDQKDTQTTTCEDPRACIEGSDVCGSGKPGWHRQGFVPPCGVEQPYVEMCTAVIGCDMQSVSRRSCVRIEKFRTQLCR